MTAAIAERIALIGFGEVGQTLGADLRAAGADDLVAWDRLFREPASGPRRAAEAQPGLRIAAGMREALGGRTLVISAVTASECVAVAREAAQALTRGVLFVDLNSVSPETKQAAAAVVEAAGGRYVEAAVMSPIGPRRAASPILLGGPHVAAFAEMAPRLGFTGLECFATEIGRASAAKMCRSVMIKGLEALLAESLLAARRYGVEDTVLSSLHDLLPAADWSRLGAYMISRSLLHGRRRAEEMREVAKAVGEVGLPAWMSAACAKRQNWAADRDVDAGNLALPALLDAILAHAEAVMRNSA